MKLRLTKMHGAGNDFVVIDATRGMPPVSLAQWRWLADRPARPAVVEVDNLVDDAPASQEDASPRYIQMAHTPRDEA